MVTQREGLSALEEHLLWCHGWVDAVLETEDYVDAVRVGLPNTSERSRVRHVNGRPEGV
jgi:hypothetical protein